MVEMAYFTTALGKSLGMDPKAILSAPSVQATAAPVNTAAAAPEAAAAPKEEKAAATKALVTVKLIKVDEGSKYKILKEIRTLKPGMNLAEVLFYSYLYINIIYSPKH